VDLSREKDCHRHLRGIRGGGGGCEWQRGREERERQRERQERGFTHRKHDIGAGRVVGVHAGRILNLWRSDGRLAGEECQIVDIVRGDLAHVMSFGATSLSFIDIASDGIDIIVTIDRDGSVGERRVESTKEEKGGREEEET
jgi:hypothetical protein